MISSEIDPFKRRGSRFLQRQARISELWAEGNITEALTATNHSRAGLIYFLFQQKPDITVKEVAHSIGSPWTTAKKEIITLRELGIPLGELPELS